MPPGIVNVSEPEVEVIRRIEDVPVGGVGGPSWSYVTFDWIVVVESRRRGLREEE